LRPFLQWFLFFCAGLILGESEVSIPLAVIIFAGILLFSLRPRWGWHLTFLCLGLWRYEMEGIAPHQNPPSLPSVARLRAIGALESTQGGYKLLCAVQSTTQPSQKTVVLVYFQREMQAMPDFGDEFLLQARWMRPRNMRGSRFDWEAYLRRRRVHWLASVYSESDFQIVQPAPYTFQSFFIGLRRSLRETLRKNLNKQDAMIMEGLMIGAPGDFPRDLRETFARAGIAHLLATSGLHVGILAIAVYLFLLKLPVSFRTRIFLTISIVWLYAVLAGFKPPIVRAATMASIFLLAPRLRREANALSALVWAAFLWLLYEPGAFWEAGFRLSFLAVLSIVLLSSHIYHGLDRFFLNRLSRKLGKWFTFRFGWLLSISASVQFGLMPVLFFNFGYVPVWSMMSNLLVASLLPFILLIGFFVWLSQGMGAILAHLGCSYLVMIANTFSRHVIVMEPFVEGWLLIFYLFILLIVPEPGVMEPEEILR
jgi:ComEC/Rec2-related protein